MSITPPSIHNAHKHPKFGTPVHTQNVFSQQVPRVYITYTDTPSLSNFRHRYLQQSLCTLWYRYPKRPKSIYHSSHISPAKFVYPLIQIPPKDPSLCTIRHRYLQIQINLVRYIQNSLHIPWHRYLERSNSIPDFHTIPRDTKDNRHSGHVGVSNKKKSKFFCKE